MGNVLYIENWAFYKMFKDLKVYQKTLSQSSDKELITEIDKIILFLKSPSCDLFQAEMAFLLVKELLQRLSTPNPSSHLNEFSVLAKKLEINLSKIKNGLDKVEQDQSHFKL